MKNKVKGFLLALAILAVLLVPRIWNDENEPTRCELLDVIDGDTISVRYEGEEVRVRFIGIDTPESVHPDEKTNTVYGVMASGYLEKILSNCSYVYLVFDEEPYDTYNRLLAYVYMVESADFKESLNYRMVQDGYALNKEYAPNTAHAYELRKACREAKQQKRGLWACEKIETIWPD